MSDTELVHTGGSDTRDAPVILTDDLTKHYGSHVGCEKICLRVDRGHIFGFLGPNGAGKSTFVKMMVGLHRPTSGSAELLGRPLGDDDTRARIGFLPESFAYQEWLTPLELLDYHGTLLGMERTARREAAAQVLAEVGLGEMAEGVGGTGRADGAGRTGARGRSRTRIREFSKGMKQRLGLACALLGAPELLFLDEPTSALDPIGRHDVRELLLRVRERGTTVFLNSHLLGEVETLCDEVAVIDHGRIVESGPLRELLAGPCEVEVSLAAPLAAEVAPLAEALGGRLVSQSPAALVIALPAEDRIPELVTRLAGAGARIAGVVRRRRTLENLFLEAVGVADGAA